MDLDTSLDQKNDFMLHMIDPQTNQLAIRFPHLLKDKCILTKVQWQDNSSGTTTEKVMNLAKKINIKSEEKAFKKAFKDGMIFRIKIIIGLSACSFVIQALRNKPKTLGTSAKTPATMPKKTLKIK
jgi:hypothetical protein